MTSNLIPSPMTADGHSRLRSSQSAIQNPKSKIQNHMAVVAVAASMLAAGCGLTKPSQSAAGAGETGQLRSRRQERQDLEERYDSQCGCRGPVSRGAGARGRKPRCASRGALRLPTSAFRIPHSPSAAILGRFHWQVRFIPKRSTSMSSELPSYVAAAQPVPQSSRGAWYKNTAPDLCGHHAMVRVLARRAGGQRHRPGGRTVARFAGGTLAMGWASRCWRWSSPR